QRRQVAVYSVPGDALQSNGTCRAQGEARRIRPLPLEGSVTYWLAQLRAGVQDAAQPLWERYFQRLVGLARIRLQGAPRRAADEEDVALSAFGSFCRGAE